MGGIFSLWGAVIAGILFKLLPALLQDWGLSSDIATILFGVGVLQVLVTAPGGLVAQVPKDLANLGRLDWDASSGEASGVSPRDRGRRTHRPLRRGDANRPHERRLRHRYVRADRPERRRQDDVLQRAERLRRPAEGSITAFGEDLLRMPDYRRARWGLQRTFQTEQAIEKLSVFDNVALVHEHTGGSLASRRSAVLEALEFVGVDVHRRGRRSGRSARASAASSRSRGRSSGGRASSFSTSRVPVSRTRRRATWARSSGGTRTASARA